MADISQYAKDDEGDQLLYKLDVAGEEICTIGLTDGKLRLKIRPDREVRFLFWKLGHELVKIF